MKILSKIQKMIFGSYCKLVDQKVSAVFYILLMVLEYLQILFLVYFENFKNNFSETSLNELTKLLFQLTTLHFIDDLINMKIVLYCFFFIFIFQIIFLFSTKKNNLGNHDNIIKRISLWILLILNISYSHFMYIPLAHTFFEFFNCRKDSWNYLSKENYCSSKEYFFYVVLASLTIAIFCFINTLNSAFLHNMNPNSCLPFSSAHIELGIISKLMKITLVIFYIFLPNQPKFKAIVLFFFSIIVFILRVLRNNFYNKYVRFFYCVIDSSIAFNGLIGIFCKYDLIKYSMRFFVIVTFSSIGFGVMIHQAQMKIVKINLFSVMNLNSSLSCNINYLIGSLILLLNLGKNFVNDKKKRFLFIGMIEYHCLNCENENCKCDIYFSKLLKRNEEGNKEFYESTKENSFTFIKQKLSKNFGNDGLTLGNITTKMTTSIAQTRTNQDIFSSDEDLSENEVQEDVQESESSKVEEEIKEDSKLVIGVFEEEAELTDEDCINRFCKIILEQHLQNTQNTNIAIIYCYVMKYNHHNYFRSLLEMMRLKMKKNNLCIDFAIFCLLCIIERELYTDFTKKEKDKIDIEKLIDYDETSNYMIENMRKVSKEMKNFWNIILCRSRLIIKPNTNISKGKNDDLYTCSRKLMKKILDLSFQYNKMLNYHQFTNKQIIFIYSIFLDKILTNKKESNSVMQKLKVIEEKNNIFNKMYRSSADIKSLFKSMDYVGITIISGEISSIGKILSVNHQACAILNYEKEDLLQESINKICPTFIGQYHDGFINQFLEKGKNRVINRVRIIFALSKDGVLVPIVLFVKVIPNLLKGVRFMGLFRKLKKDHPFLKPDINPKIYSTTKSYFEVGKVTFILTNNKGEIFGGTKNALKIYGIPLNHLNSIGEMNNSLAVNKSSMNLFDKAVTLSMIFPKVDFNDEEVISKMKKSEGLFVTLNTTLMKRPFDDFKEALLSSSSKNMRYNPVIKVVSQIKPKSVFKDNHFAICILYELYINEGKLNVKLFKLIEMKKFDILSSKTTKNIPKIKFSKISSSSCKPYSSTSFLKRFRRYSTVMYTEANTVRSNFSDGSDSRKEEREDEMMRFRNFYEKLLKIAMKKRVNISTKLFFLLLIFANLLFITFTLIEYYLSFHSFKKLLKFFEFSLEISERNIVFTSLIMYFRVLIMEKNKLIIEDEVDFDKIISKMKLDLTTISFLNNKILSDYEMLYTKFYSDNITLIVSNSLILNTNFTTTQREEQSEFLVNLVLIKLNQLILNNQGNDLIIENPKDLFYFNKEIQPKSATANDILKEIFFISENSKGPIQFYFSQLNEFLTNMIIDLSEIIDLNRRIYACIPPIIIVGTSLILFYFLLKSIGKYKSKLLRFLYVIDKNFGEQKIKDCNEFVDTMNKNITGLSYLNAKGEIVNKDLGPPETQRINTEEDNLISTQRDSEPKWVPFWDKTNEIVKNSIKRKKDFMNNEITKSKKKFWKVLHLLYFFLVFIFIVFFFYFGVLMIINLKFEHNGLKEKENIIRFLLRGWVINNMITFYREVIFQGEPTSISSFSPEIKIEYQNFTQLSKYDNLTSFDLYSFHLNYTDEIENNLLLLSSKKVIDKSVSNIVYPSIIYENNFNTKNFCGTLKNLSRDFYDEYQNNCDEHFENNSGLRDNIRVIYAYLKSNPHIFNKNDYETQIKYLNLNVSFVHQAQLYISQAILGEISTISKSVNMFTNSYIKNSRIRIGVFLGFIFLEIVIWIFISIYLVKETNKDKMILQLIPFEGINVDRKIFDNLKELQ